MKTQKNSQQQSMKRLISFVTILVSFSSTVVAYTTRHLFRRQDITSTCAKIPTIQPTTFSTTSRGLAATGSVLPDLGLLKKLPWNVRKERLREQRRLQVERAKLHRQIGIVEDATYEEIVAATDRLIAEAGNDLKKKIQIEIAKDKILQIRLNERLAGLLQNSKEARAQSTYELEG